MCIFGSNKPQQTVKNITPAPTALPDKAPAPVEIKKDGQSRVSHKRNPLRIELANKAASGANSGVNV